MINFTQDDAIHQGTRFKESIIASRAIPIRPMVLTAQTTATDAFPIILAPGE